MKVTNILDIILKNVTDGNNQQLASDSELQQHTKPRNLLNRIEREELAKLEKKWKDKSVRLSLVDFVKLFLTVLDHNNIELLFMVIGLTELFKEIMASKSYNKPEILFDDITTFICCSNDNGEFLVKVLEQRIAEPKKFELNLHRIREIDKYPPIILGGPRMQSRIQPGKVVTDSVKHSNTVQCGVYAKEINKIITLDCLGTKLNLYNINLDIDQYITLKKQNDKSDDSDKEVIIIGFAWSSRQQRIGITLKSHFLCFFDLQDNFNYSMQFQTVNVSAEYQTSIWYLENYDMWLTTDATFKLYQWDIQHQNTIKIFQSKIIKGAVVEAVELVHLKLIATASLDKQIVIWDTVTGGMKLYINMHENGGVHSMVYSYHYQVLIVCGYATYVTLFSIDPNSFDTTVVGKIYGHTSMLTAVQMLGKSPNLFSSDDTGNIKIWDIRNFTCVQSLNYGRKTSILKLLDLSDQGLLCFLGSRVNIIEFDDRASHTLGQSKKQVQKDKETVNENYPIRIEFDPLNEELIVASRNDIQFINIHNGRVSRILKGVMGDSEDEIVNFKPINHFNRFLLGDSRGNLTIHSMQNGEKLKQLQGFSQDICQLRLDIVNQLIISAGWDQLHIQRETSKGGEILRELKNFQNSQEVTHLEISLHHNILITASTSSKVTIWDYEFLRSLGEIIIIGEVTFLSFVNQYDFFVVGTNNSLVYFIHFIVRDQQEIYCDVLAILDLFSVFNDECVLPSKGYETHSSPYRRPSLLQKELLTRKNSIFLLTQDTFQLPDSVNSVNKDQLHKASYRLINEYGNKSLIVVQALNTHSQESSENNERNQVELLIGTNKGNIHRFNLNIVIEVFKLKQSKPVYEKLNYNAFRQSREDYLNSVSKFVNTTLDSKNYIQKFSQKILEISEDELLSSWKAQKTTIQCMNLLSLDAQFILSSANDGIIKVHDLMGKLICQLNINHPLPTIWDIKYTKTEQFKKQIVYAFKIVDLLQKQSKNEVERQNYDLGDLAAYYNKAFQERQQLTNLLTVIPSRREQPKKSKKSLPVIQVQKPVILVDSIQRSKNNVILMKEEYSPRDVQFDSVRNIYQHELQGASLKEMTVHRRFLDAQNQWKQSVFEDKEKDAQFQLQEKEKLKYMDKGGNLSFLEPGYHQGLLYTYKQESSQQNLQALTNFAEKLDNAAKTISKVQIQHQDSSSTTTKPIKLKSKQLPKTDRPYHRKILSEHTSHGNFVDYASKKNLTRDHSNKGTFITGATTSVNTMVINDTSLLSNYHVSNSSKLEFKPSFFIKNISKIDEIKEFVPKLQQSLGAQKKQRQSFNNILVNINQKVKKSKNKNFNEIGKLICKRYVSILNIGLNDPERSIINVPVGDQSKASFIMPESKEQQQFDQKIDDLVEAIQQKARKSLARSSRTLKYVNLLSPIDRKEL